MIWNWYANDTILLYCILNVTYYCLYMVYTVCIGDKSDRDNVHGMPVITQSTRHTTTSINRL